MADTITDYEFKLLRGLIEKLCGIHLEPEKMYLVENRLTTLMIENGCDDYTAFYHKAINEKSGSLRDKVIEAMTTLETLWFRDTGPFEILNELLKTMAGEIKSGRRSGIRIWAAACSSGQEPYSIAMSVLESARSGSGLRPEQVEICATDISSTALFLAQTGRYDPIAISRGLPDDQRNRYFKQEGRIWVISDDVKKMVSFKKLNLQENWAWLGSRDIVFCRNVLIYFSESFKRDILKRLTAVLKPSGYLFVGSSESVSPYSGDYTMLKHQSGLYYRVKH
jgi:chemotaxis protein methyltransferase CheR